MNAKVIFPLLFLLTSLPATSSAQKIETDLRGYVKDLHSFYLFDGGDNLVGQHNIHSRLNFKWHRGEYWSGAIELRQQFYYGEFIKLTNDLPRVPGILEVNFSDLILGSGDELPLTFKLLDKRSVFWYLKADRFWVDWQKKDWKIRLGRQRVNWGLNWAWNPNDLFNAFSYFDFDYEERPGADAILIQRYFGDFSSVEIVGNYTKNFNRSILATRLQGHFNTVDWQVISAYKKDFLIVGGGWSNAIKNIGFKGEISSHIGLKQNDSKILVATGFDYAFKNSLIVQGEILFNSAGSHQNESFLDFSIVDLTELSPYKWSVFAAAAYPIHPLLTANLGLMIFPSEPSFYLAPGLSWSLKQDLDWLFMAQIVSKQSIPLPGFGDLSGIVSTRLRWSF